MIVPLFLATTSSVTNPGRPLTPSKGRLQRLHGNEPSAGAPMLGSDTPEAHTDHLMVSGTAYTYMRLLPLPHRGKSRLGVDTGPHVCPPKKRGVPINMRPPLNRPNFSQVRPGEPPPYFRGSLNKYRGLFFRHPQQGHSEFSTFCIFTIPTRSFAASSHSSILFMPHRHASSRMTAAD